MLCKADLLNKYVGYFRKLIIKNYTLQQNSNLTTINLDWLGHGVVTDLLVSKPNIQH